MTNPLSFPGMKDTDHATATIDAATPIVLTYKDADDHINLAFRAVDKEDGVLFSHNGSDKKCYSLDLASLESYNEDRFRVTVRGDSWAFESTFAIPGVEGEDAEHLLRNPDKPGWSLVVKVKKKRIRSGS